MQFERRFLSINIMKIPIDQLRVAIRELECISNPKEGKVIEFMVSSSTKIEFYKMGEIPSTTGPMPDRFKFIYLRGNWSLWI
jgi:hypothetical protein